MALTKDTNIDPATVAYFSGLPDGAERLAQARAIMAQVADIEAKQAAPAATPRAATFNAPSPSPSALSLAGSYQDVGPPAPTGGLNAVRSGTVGSAGPMPGNMATVTSAPLTSTFTPVGVPTYDDLVSNAYKSVGRAGFGTGATQIDQPGFNYWKSQLESGAITPDDFATAFSAASTGESPEEVVARTYGLYGRAGTGTGAEQIDPAGFKYWTDQLKSGQLTPTDFSKRFSYDMTKDATFGANVKGQDVHNFVYDNIKNPYSVLDYAVSQGLKGEDLAKATGMTMTQIRDYFGPVYNPLGPAIDKPGIGVGGQYGYVNGVPILNRTLVDTLLKDNSIGDQNFIIKGNQGAADNSIGWDTGSVNSSYAVGPAAFGVEKFSGMYGQGTRYEGDLEGLARKVGIDPSKFQKTVPATGYGGAPTTTLDQDALYDAVSAATKDYYRVVGAVAKGTPDSSITRNDVSGNHASVLYKAYNDKLVPVGDPMYFSANIKDTTNPLLQIAPIALSFMFPGIGTKIGQALTLKGASAAIVGNAIYGAGISALTGNDPIKGAVSGGVGGAAGFYAPTVAANVLGAGDEALGAARVAKLAETAGMTSKQVSEIVSGSLASGLNAAIIGGQDALETFALTLAASFAGTKAKQVVNEFKKDFKRADFEKAATYAANAADSVTRSLITGEDVVANLATDMGDARQQIEDIFSEPRSPGAGTQIGPPVASTTDVDLSPYVKPSDYDEQGNLKIEISGTADDIKTDTASPREREIRSLFGLGTPDPSSAYASVIGKGGTGGVEDYAVFAIDVGERTTQQVITELENWKTQAETPEQKEQIDKAISKVRYIDVAARSDQVDPKEIVNKEFKPELENAKRVIEQADEVVRKAEEVEKSERESEVEAESPNVKTDKASKSEDQKEGEATAESSGATIISPGAGGTTQVADSTVAGGSQAGGGSEAGGSEAGGATPGVPKAQADALVDELYDKAGFADPEGAKWWSDQMTTGKMTPEHVQKAFAEALKQPDIVSPTDTQSGGKPGGESGGQSGGTSGGQSGSTGTTGTGATGTDTTGTGTTGTGTTGTDTTGTGTTSTGGTGTGVGVDTGSTTGTGTGTDTGQGTSTGTATGAGPGQGTGVGTGENEGTGGDQQGSGGSGPGAGSGVSTGVTGTTTTTTTTGGASGGSGPKPEIETPEKPFSMPPLPYTADTANSPPTREWFDRYLNTSITPSRYEGIFDPVAATESLIEDTSDGATDMQFPSMAAAGMNAEPTIEELVAMLSGGPQPSYYSYGAVGDEIEPLAAMDPNPVPTQTMRRGGLASLRSGGPAMAAPLMAAEGGVPHKGSHYVQGAGGGQDDLIDARLADGEYVFDADIVAALGDGSNAEGARRLDKMREQIRKHKRSAPNDKIPPKARSPLAYLKEAK